MQILCCAGLVHLCTFIERMKTCNMLLLPRSVDMEVSDIFRCPLLHIMLYPNRYSSALFVCSRTPSHSLHDGGFAANLRAASISSPAFNRGPQSGDSMPDEEQATAWEKLPIYSAEKALFHRSMTTWPSGLRRYVQVVFRKGVSSNLTVVTPHLFNQLFKAEEECSQVKDLYQ